MFDVITMGSATVDAFVNTGSKLFGTCNKKGLCSVPFGTKMLIDDIKFDIGGGGTNTAVALARLGLKTAYIGSIGCGENSKRVIHLLKKEKVGTSLMQRCAGRTAYSIILDAKGHDRTILAFKGNNNGLDFQKIKLRKLKTKWFYFSSMLDKSFDAQKKVAEFAVKKNIKIAYNPSSYLVKKGSKFIKPVLSKSYLLVLNSEEAGYLSNNKKVKDVLKYLLSLGPKIVVITDGPKSVYAADKNHVYSVNPTGKKVLEATGAGDAFASSFLAGLIIKDDISYALRFGVANSESVITHYGAKNKLLKYDEILQRIKNIKVKVKKL